jgi:hypothetical protein
LFLPYYGKQAWKMFQILKDYWIPSITPDNMAAKVRLELLLDKLWQYRSFAKPEGREMEV